MTLTCNFGHVTVYKVKYQPNGFLDCRKTHLVTRGFTQENVEEIFTLVAQIPIVRTLLVIICPLFVLY